MALKHEEVTSRIIKVFYEVYNELGHGFLESVYESAMRLALVDAGLATIPKSTLEVLFRGQPVGHFQPDILVNDCVILELKAGRCIDSAHEAQLLNDLRATNIEAGLILNFGPKPEIKRMLFDNERKLRRVASLHSGG